MSKHAFQRVLVGWDGSPSALKGLKWACELTTSGGGTVTALAVVPSFRHVEGNEDREHALADAQEPLQEAFDAAVASLQPRADHEPSLRFIEDDQVGKALDQYVAEQMIDLLVVGLHGREGILHPKIGHIANHVVKSASCPVLVIPAPPQPGAIHLEEDAGGLRGLFHIRHHSHA